MAAHQSPYYDGLQRMPIDRHGSVHDGTATGMLPCCCMVRLWECPLSNAQLIASRSALCKTFHLVQGWPLGFLSLAGIVIKVLTALEGNSGPETTFQLGRPSEAAAEQH